MALQSPDNMSYKILGKIQQIKSQNENIQKQIQQEKKSLAKFSTNISVFGTTTSPRQNKQKR